jgi:hypothetical protein
LKKPNQVVSILASFCVWTKSLICKDAAHRDSTVQSDVRRISKFPVSRPDDVSSRPDAHLSGQCVILFGRQTVQHLPSGRRASSVRTLHSIEKLLCQLAPSGRFSSMSGRLSVLERFTKALPSSKKGKINQPSGRCGIPFGRVSP